MSDSSKKPEVKDLGRVIYTAPEQMVKMIRSIKKLSISTTVLSMAVQPILIPKLMATGSTMTMSFACLTFGGVILSPLVLNWFTKRYVTELHYNDAKQQFAAEHLNIINRKVMLHYKAEDVKVPESLGLFTTYLVKKKPFFIDQNLVTDYDPYKKMLGFDKPLDLRADELVEQIRKLKAEKVKTQTDAPKESEQEPEEQDADKQKRQSQ